MAKKPRSQRRKNGGAALDKNNNNGSSTNNNDVVEAAEYLSESHTIATAVDNDNDSMLGGGFDDDWEMGDDNVNDIPNENDLRAAEV
jgi:hypothetical protein